MREMKNSGIEWIGQIPVEWNIIKCKYVASLYTGNSIKDENKSLYEDFINAIPYISTKDIDVVFNTINYENGLYIKNNDYSFVRANKNDILMCIEGGSAGRKKARLDKTVCFVNKLCCFHATKINSLFLYYLLNSPHYEEEFKFNISGLIGGVSKNKLENFIFPYPMFEEQQKISAYLDDKCTKIDSIIEKQQKIIDKLKEYKQSIITEAVTKGLNPDVKMKDNGYEFIGTVPEHWNVCRLRNIGTPQNGISKGGDFFGHGYPFVSYGDVYRNFLLPETVNGLVETTEEEREQYSVKEGDILFTRTSETIEEVGFSSVCEKDIENATFAGFIIRVRPFIDDLITGFAKYYFRSNHHRFYLVKEMNLVTRASLGQNLLKSMPVLLPPKTEQQAIADYLDKKCTAIDSVIEKKQAIIEKLTEYKKSLIYEVVTGKKEV